MSFAQLKSRAKEQSEVKQMFFLPGPLKKILTSDRLSRNFHLTAAGYFSLPGIKQAERKYGINEYVLIYCTEGKGLILIDEVACELKPGGYLIIPPKKKIKIENLSGLPFFYYRMHFDGIMVVEIHGLQQNIESGIGVAPVKNNAQLLPVFEKVVKIVQKKNSYGLLQVANVLFMYLLISLLHESELDILSSNKDVVDDALMFMNANVNSRCTVQDFAGRQNISASHFSKLFKDKTGSSPVNYFNELKIKEACGLLQHSSRSIKSIALELGFEDQYYFSRLFKKVHGISPTFYRQPGAQ